jgi:hypothetical protein
MGFAELLASLRGPDSLPDVSSVIRVTSRLPDLSNYFSGVIRTITTP